MTTWQRPSHVAMVDQPVAREREEMPGGVLYLGPLPDGPVVVLEGAAAAIYRAAIGDHETDLLELVAAGLGVGSEAVERSEVSAFILELVRRNLIEEAPTLKRNAPS